MRAECLFKKGDYEAALAEYDKVKGTSSQDFQVLALLHAGQAAAQLKRWEESLRWLVRCITEFPASPYAPQALYEQAWAHQNLGKHKEAIALYEQVIAKTGGEVAARAQFMIGEIQFADKIHAEAVKSFFKVVYGYSYPHWQAEAAYEAARCFEVLDKKTQAVKMYQELLEKFPTSDKTTLARQRLEDLEG
jgi:TolA-binding protein